MRQFKRRRSSKWTQSYLAGFVALGIFLIGCSLPGPAMSPHGSNTDAAGNSSSPQAMGQLLPISAQVKIADQVIQLEVAQTPDQQAMGLMYRASLADDRGMLFSFNPARRVGFWMKNVVIPLDMVFLHKGQVAAIEPSAPPCAAEPCPIYGPNAPVDQVIELRGGRAAALGLKAGDRLQIQPLNLKQ